jgi:hypothetical protein
MEFKLFELNNDLLALDAEHSAPQLLNDRIRLGNAPFSAAAFSGALEL